MILWIFYLGRRDLQHIWSVRERWVIADVWIYWGW